MLKINKHMESESLFVPVVCFAPPGIFLLIIKLFISNKGKGVKGLKEDLLNNCKMNAAKPTELSFREFKFQ